MLRFDLSPRWRGHRLGILIGLCCIRTAVAQSPVPAVPPVDATSERATAGTAQARFEEAKALYQTGKLEAACPMFAESYALEPDTGVLLALATCYKDQGKLSSAWKKFRTAEDNAHDKDPAREQYARDARLELEPRLSKVQVDVAPSVAATPGLELRVDEIVLAKSEWNKATPLDGGEHTIVASAPQRKPWQGKFVLKSESDTQHVPVEMLMMDPAVEQKPVAEKREGRPWDSLEWGGVVMAGVGLTCLGIATIIGTRADPDNEDDPQWSKANGVGIPGAVLLGGGMILFLAGGPPSHPTQSTPQVALSFGRPLSGGWGVAIHGTL